MARTLFSGNEAVARGAWEAGVAVGVGYPGTPSTEVLENLVRYEGVRCEWAPNEKVAAEVAAGVSLAGGRVIVTMKHVGLNVAADPLFTLAYTGVGGGYVLFVADDPGMHSSQNEQDSRRYAVAAKVPMLEPADPAEALAMTRAAFEISEEFDVPVLVRSTTRVSHSKGVVEVDGARAQVQPQPYIKDPAKWVMVPANARRRRIDLEERLVRLAEHAELSGLNRVELRDRSLGVIVDGAAYRAVREALPDASVLKIGMVHPFPRDLVRAFAAEVESVAVVEELGPFVRDLVVQAGVAVREVPLPAWGEVTPAVVRAAFGVLPLEVRKVREGVPERPPLMCPGCPHRGVFWALKRTKAVVTGDIGCYTLGAAPPLAAMDSCICMGASVGMAHGASLVERERPVIGVIGDSTFAHSGITGLVHMAYNGSHGTIVVLDNRTTAMTGHQGNPISGVTLSGEHTSELDLEALARACGAGWVRTVDPFDLATTLAALKEAIAAPTLAVLIAKAPCALLEKRVKDPVAVDDDVCTACGSCIQLGCPAISKADSGNAQIDVTICVGCGQCEQVCRFGAIVPAGPACDLGGSAR
ncbi:indolepyruvate ferredoxin oxidoreductase subunit alpha [Coriobacteriia bacterium Es71-Z0120]|uniref:indolepyruvate ferredoxin oxidoreductase subunit alpha n=1 Tax=Parvivirga hydrogeniphila TaxID=2939460 RepID=UPI002260A0DA|nr:indolepyruvate ferredoxin oxidoreductase subunit alpha [Parvivirga hydrogeniphila]MCL4079653.1 indolepyruvate ferredoxin oxidoreductase subunit alpha [Parvivirga hydrogeniphila]